MTEATRRFLEFQRTRSAHALAEVFDACAPELLLLATHIVRDRTTAEDVLQQTFLHAMQSAARFRANGDVHRWLTGILVNNSRKELRTRRRSVDPQRLPPEPIAHPEQEAKANELLEQLQSALRSLPSRYRDVLHLALLHGQEPRAIAAKLGRSEHTVRTQFRRGIERLRQHLPRGFAGACVAAFAAADGLRAARRSLLEHAELAVDVRSAGPSPVRAWSWSAAALLATIGAVLLARGGAPPVADAETIAQSSSVLEVRPVRVAAKREAPQLSRADERLVVNVRWSDGSPARGVRVLARPAADRSWLRERCEQADANGVATFDRMGAQAWRIRTARGGAAVVSSGVVDLSIPSGVRVACVVEDGMGAPVAGARVFLGRVSPAMDDAAEVGRTDSEGMLELRDVDPSLFVACERDGYVSPPAQTLAIGRDATTRVHFTAQHAGSRLKLALIGPNGAPAVDARVFVSWNSFSPRDRRNRHMPHRRLADASGRIELDSLPARTDVTVWARTEHSATCVAYAYVSGRPPVEDVVLRLQEGASVVGVARSRRGLPRDGVTVHAYQFAVEEFFGRDQFGPGWARARGRTDATGSFRLDHLVPGKCRVELWDGEKGCASSRFELEDGQCVRWRARIVPGGEIRGTLRDSVGRALSGWNVEQWRDDFGNAPMAIARTRPDGTFRLPNCQDREYELRIYDPRVRVGSRGFVRRARPRGPALPIVVPDAHVPQSSFRLAVLDPDGDSLRPERCYVTMERPHSLPMATYPLQLGADGVGELGPLPPGRYQLSVATAEHGLIDFGWHTLGPRQVQDLGVRRAARTGRAVFRIRDAAGKPVSLDLKVWHRTNPLVYTRVAVRNGRGSGVFAPGSHAISVWTSDIPMLYREFTIEPGARRRIDVRIPEPARRIVLFPAVAEAGTMLEYTVRDACGRVRLRKLEPRTRTDRPEKVYMAFAPGSYDFDVTDRRGRKARTRFRVARGESDPDSMIEIDFPRER